MTNHEFYILSRIKAAVQSLDPNAQIILFGSRARGDARHDSDWDLLILIEKESDLYVEQKFRHLLFDLEIEFNICISVFVKSALEWESKYSVTPLFQNVLKEGIRV
jgi:predicted nucleotidyltransferase